MNLNGIDAILSPFCFGAMLKSQSSSRPSRPSRPSDWILKKSYWLKYCTMILSLDWFKGKSTGNHGFYHQI